MATAATNAMHGPWSFALTLVLIGVSTRVLGWARRWRTVGDVFGVAFLVAVGTEALQVFSSREASWSDVGLDMLGAVAALGVWAGSVGLCRRWQGILVAAVALVVSLAPLVGAVGIRIHQRAIEPSLVRFENPLWRTYVRSSGELRVRASELPWPRGSALEVRLADERWPGFRLHEPLPDWSAYQRFRARVFVLGDDALRLNIAFRFFEIDEQVIRSFELEPGPHEIELELAEVFDAQVLRVKELLFYSRRAYAGREFLVGNIDLHVD